MLAYMHDDDRQINGNAEGLDFIQWLQLYSKYTRGGDTRQTYSCESFWSEILLPSLVLVMLDMWMGLGPDVLLKGSSEPNHIFKIYEKRDISFKKDVT